MFCMEVDVLEHAVQYKQPIPSKQTSYWELTGRDETIHHASQSGSQEDVIKQDTIQLSEREAAHERFLIHRRESQIEEVQNYINILDALRLRSRQRQNAAYLDDDPVFTILSSILRQIEDENAEERKRRRERKRQRREIARIRLETKDFYKVSNFILAIPFCFSCPQRIFFFII